MILLILLAGLAVTGLLFAEGTGSSARLVAKPVASTMFILIAVNAGAAETGFGRWVLVALALSWIGDVLLLGRGVTLFLAGLISFLIAHLAYVAAFAARGVVFTATAAWSLALALPAVIVLRWLLPHVSHEMRVPVIAYATIISLMVGFALGAAAAGESWWLVAAASAFYISDLAVARDRFVAPGFGNRLWGLPLYYGAQVVFAILAGG